MDVAGFFRSDLQVSGHLNGALEVEGPLESLVSRADFIFSPRTTDPGRSQPSVLLHADFRGDARVPRTWKVVTDVTVSGLRYGETLLEDLVLQVETRDPGPGNTLFADLEWRQSDALLDASGHFELEGANAIGELKNLPWRGETRLSVPDLGRVRQDFPARQWREIALDGDLEGNFRELVYSNGVLQSGNGTIRSEALSLEGQKFERFEIKANVEEPGMVAGSAAIVLDPNAKIDGHFAWDLEKGLYRGKIDGIADQGLEGKLGNLLRGRPASQLFPGKTKLSWSGQGNLKDGTRKGSLALDAEGIHLAEGTEPLALKMSGRYSSDSASFPGFRITSRPLQLHGSIEWENSRLFLRELRGVSGEKTVISGSASLPLDPSRLSSREWFAQAAPLEIDLDLSNLPLETVARCFMPDPPVDARIQSGLRVSGSPVAPVLNLDFDADGIRVAGKQRSDWSVGVIDLNLAGGDGKVSLKGEYRHPEINPVRIEGEMPLFPGEWVSGARNLKREPVQASIRMNHSSLAFLTSQVPGLESVSGTASLDSEIRGELTRPELSGSGSISLDLLKFEDRNAPDIKEMKSLVRFTDDLIQLEQLSAIVAGGILEARGEARLRAGEEPAISLEVSGKDVLVVRNRDLNLRTDANLNLRGPWSRVAIEGDLGITNSRYFKNVDLFPSRLPLSGRSRVPDPAERGGFQGGGRNELDIGVKSRPFADWTADIRIHTRNPFLVRGNLARASANADLRIRGPLSDPVPVGSIALNEAIATLPFSRIDVEVGRVRFDEKTGFNGNVEFKGRSRVENYRVSIYVHGDLLSPKYVLTSVPPLPSEDIITLLATGTVRSELIGGDATRMAASKAASLFLKNLRKASAEADRESNLFDDLRERTELEIGRVNPDTGTQTFGGKIRLWRQLFFVGDVDRENDYRALLKYIFSLD
jgi:autotransporter translocation and assembly factor TamB